MNLGLKGKVAVVLASSRGMGRACAELLGEEGCRVAMCARSKKPLEEAARAVRRAGAQDVLARALDVEKRAEARQFVSQVVKRFGGIHVLVTNCGGPPPGKPLELDDAAWDAAVQSTLMVAVNWIRAAAPVMIRQRWGRIVNITSIAVKEPIDNLVLSNTMRTGVIGFAKTMARELAPHGITVNNLCPGRILTDRLRSLAAARAKDRKTNAGIELQLMADEVPMKRIGTPEEFAGAVAFLASERAAYITGATVQVDGGIFRGLM